MGDPGANSPDIPEILEGSNLMIRDTAFSILIVDDEPENAHIAASILAAPDRTFTICQSGSDALKKLERDTFDLFLLDIMMPEMDGIELSGIIKQKREYALVPVIFLTAKTNEETILRAFGNGAVDYIAKPFLPEELIHRVQAHLTLRDAQKKLEEYSRELQIQLQKAREAEAEIARANEALAALASTDPLTGLLNRRRGWEILEYEASRSIRNAGKTTILLFDIDHFKSINDSFGHDKGDTILINVAEKLTRTLRKQDSCIRWGGEEFLVIMPETGLDGGYVAAEKIREDMEHADWDLGNQSLTISIGVASQSPGEDWNTTIQRADRALYEAKSSGRNRTVVSHPATGNLHTPDRT
jgi:two-component system, cell cycle response regulator